MIAVLFVLVGLMAGSLIFMQREVDRMRENIHRMTGIHQQEQKLFHLTSERLKSLELAQQEQLDRIVDLTAAVAQNHGDLKRWTYQNVNDIWYAIDNPLTGKEEESEEVRS